MSKTRIILILGIWIMVLPYLGFPYYIKNILFTLSGLFLVYLSFLTQKELKSIHGDEEKESFDSFSENNDFVEENITNEN